MTVSSAASRKAFAGDGSTVAFNFPYEYRAAADLKVYLVTAAFAATLKTITTHYSVSGVSDSHGGYSSATVTMVTAPASGETLVIFRDPSPVQETNLESDGDPLYATNNALDLLTYHVQRFANDGLKLPNGVSESFSATLPDLPDDDGSTYYLTPNAARTALVWGAELDGATVSAAMVPVVEAATLAAARTALGVSTGDLLAANNLSDLASAATARTNLGLGTGNSPQFTGVELGHASDTTLTRSAAGVLAVEGVDQVNLSASQTLTNKTLTSPTINGGTIQSRVQVSSETTGTLTSASANKSVVCTGGITLPNSVFTAGDCILFDPGTSGRTFTRGSGIAMYVNGSDAASATLAANKTGSAYWRTASVVVLAGGFS